MKKLFSFFAMLAVCATLMAQSPSAFKYQAVARQQSGEAMADQPMSVRISILKGAQVEYSEVHSVTTNDLGLFTVEIGRGSPISGTFYDIVWNEDPHFVRVEMDPAGGSNYVFVGVSELVSVPYAMHAETVTHNDDADADPANEIQDLKVVGNYLRVTNNPNPTQIDLTQFDTDAQQISYDADNFVLSLENGGSVNLQTLMDDADANPANELQTVTQVGSVVTLSQGGGTFSVEDADANPANELQTLSQVGNTVSLSQGGGSVTITEADGDPENELQDLVFNNNYLYISNQANPTVVDLNHLLDNTDAQQLSYDSVTGNLSITDGGVVNLSSLEEDADADVTNELQTIMRVGDDIVLSHNGGTVNIQDGDSDISNEIQTVSQNGLTVTLSNGGGSFSVADDDNSIVNEIQDLMIIGDSLVITNNPSATIINLGAHDNQTLNFDSSTYELTIASGNTVDLSDLKDDDDSNPLNEIQDLYLSNDSLVITSNPWATVIDMGPYMDNTDAQDMTLTGNTLSLTGDATTVDLTSFLDNTDAQTLSIASDSLSISGGNKVDLSAYLDADNMGNHIATQNVEIGAFYMSNDGDSEGIRISTTGNVVASGNFFVGETATTNSDAYISGRLYDWDNSSYYVDPDFQSSLTDLRVSAGLIVNTGSLTVSMGGFNVTGASTIGNDLTVNNGDIDIDDTKAFYFGDKTTDGSWRIVRSGSDLSFERREAGAWVQKDIMTP